MIRNKRKFHTTVKHADHIYWPDAFRLSLYTAYTGKDSFGFIKQHDYSVQIDLTQSEEEILQGCKSNTRNEIRRGIKEGYIVEKIENTSEFVSFYNEFAKEKHLSRVREENISSYEKIYLYKVSKEDGTVLSMHASVGDLEAGIVSLLYSASVRLQEGIDRKSVGFANRLLHYREFIEFKRIGYKLYDFTNVCLDEKQPEKYKIGLFKQGFGGNIVEYYSLYSVPFWLTLKIKNIIGELMFMNTAFVILHYCQADVTINCVNSLLSLGGVKI